MRRQLTPTTDLARGKWRGVLSQLGVEPRYLTGKHTPCPKCGGHDRFRFDDKDGKGTWICSFCGAGSGFGLLELVKGWDFRTAAREVDAIVGSIAVGKIKSPLDEGKRRRDLNALWKHAKPINPNDQAGCYLASRGLTLPDGDSLRYSPATPVPYERNELPALVAMVSNPDGTPATLHRTFLGPNGKADIEQPRALMPGPVPEGAAIRLTPASERLGIAEGIETALAASARFGLPVWSAINSTILSKWAAPADVREVVIFGDNDAKYGGQAAAYQLAHRLACRTDIAVSVMIPKAIGTDWADA